MANASGPDCPIAKANCSLRQYDSKTSMYIMTTSTINSHGVPATRCKKDAGFGIEGTVSAPGDIAALDVCKGDQAEAARDPPRDAEACLDMCGSSTGKDDTAAASIDRALNPGPSPRDDEMPLRVRLNKDAAACRSLGFGCWRVRAGLSFPRSVTSRGRAAAGTATSGALACATATRMAARCCACFRKRLKTASVTPEARCRTFAIRPSSLLVELLSNEFFHPGASPSAPVLLSSSIRSADAIVAASERSESLSDGVESLLGLAFPDTIRPTAESPGAGVAMPSASLSRERENSLSASPYILVNTFDELPYSVAGARSPADFLATAPGPLPSTSMTACATCLVSLPSLSCT